MGWDESHFGHRLLCDEIDDAGCGQRHASREGDLSIRLSRLASVVLARPAKSHKPFTSSSIGAGRRGWSEPKVELTKSPFIVRLARLLNLPFIVIGEHFPFWLALIL